MNKIISTRGWRVTAAVGVASLVLSAGLGAAQDFRITQATLDPTGKFRLVHPADPAFYYILFRGDKLEEIRLAADMALGVAATGTLADARNDRAASFYRVRRIPVSQPLDTDGDGIDDVWELQHAPQLNPLFASDASQPAGAPGSLTWKQVYEAEKAVTLAPFAAFAMANSRFLETAGNVEIAVRLSKPYFGPLKFQIGGTAIAGRDFDEIYAKPADESFTGSVIVNGTSATIPLRLRTNDFVDLERSVVLTLQQPAGTNAFRLGSPSTHILTITEGDHGVFGGAIFFTNGVVLASQPVKLALRSVAGGGTAFFDTSSATLFQRRPITLPVQFGVGAPFTPMGTATGSLPSDVLGRPLDWALELIQPVLETNTLSARVNLRLRGLSASGREVLAQGVLVLHRMDAGQ